MARSTSDGHHRGLYRKWRFAPVVDRCFQERSSSRPTAGRTGYEPVAEEPPEVMAISCMRCVKPFNWAGISVTPAVGNSAIA
jgi:hypothetical protein